MSFINDRVVLLSAVYKWPMVDWRRSPPKPQPRRLARLAARLAQSLTLLRCGAYCAELRPRGCPFESHRNRTAASRLPSLAVRALRALTASLAPSARGPPGRSPGRATAAFIYKWSLLSLISLLNTVSPPTNCNTHSHSRSRCVFSNVPISGSRHATGVQGRISATRRIAPLNTSIPTAMSLSTTSNVLVWWPPGWSVPTPT
jgi:hypothetical protein